MYTCCSPSHGESIININLKNAFLNQRESKNCDFEYTARNHKRIGMTK